MSALPSHAVISAIECNSVAKRFQYTWVFKEFSYTFQPNICYGIKGPNGSGKSTLLKILCGYSTPNKGDIRFVSGAKDMPVSDVFRHIAIAAPYIDLLEEMTVAEIVKFHHSLKPLDDLEFIENEIIQLPFPGLKDKKISELSSGMKQRIKLLLAIGSAGSILILDEPGSNLDEVGKRWWHLLLGRFIKDKIVIIASNESDDLSDCTELIDISSYKNFKKT